MLLRPRRLELPYLSALAPQASVSTSSTIAAIYIFLAKIGIKVKRYQPSNDD